ncbi:MAG: hypothetical protein C4311_03685 [Chloroflexota bacterium]
MTPFGHLIVGAALARWLRERGLSVQTKGVLVGSVLPDVDFFAVHTLGFPKSEAHRTWTHSPIALLLAGLALRRLGIGSVIVGGLSHILIDNFIGGNPPGVGWAYPLVRGRIPLGPHLRWGQATRPPAWVSVLVELAAIFFVIVAIAGRRTTTNRPPSVMRPSSYFQ